MTLGDWLGFEIGGIDWQTWLESLQTVALPRFAQSIVAALIAAVVVWLSRRVTAALEARQGEGTRAEIFQAVIRLGGRVAALSVCLWALWRIYGIWGLPPLGSGVGIVWLVAVAFPFSRFVTDLLVAYERRLETEREVALEGTSLPLVHTVIRVVLISVVALTGLQLAGIPIGPLLGSAGILGLAVSFAAQDTFANLIAGVLLILDRPFRVGDRIKLWDVADDAAAWGDVIEIGLRATKVRDPDNVVSAIPNSEIMNRDITNYTSTGEHIRMRVPISVDFGVDLELVRRLILQAAEDIEAVLPDPPPAVVATRFGEQSVELELRVWIPEVRQRATVRDRITDRLKPLFEEHGVEIPDVEPSIMVFPGSGGEGFGSNERGPGAPGVASGADVAHARGTTVQAAAGGTGSRGYSARRITAGTGGELELRPARVEQEHYVLRGSAWTRIGDEEIQVFAGDCVFLPAGVPHAYRVIDAPFEYLRLVARGTAEADSPDQG